MKINVAKKHIELAACKDPHKCMIAAAIKEEFQRVAYVSVRTNGITLTTREKDGTCIREHFAVPTKAARAIIAFDQGEPVKPFSFEAKKIDEKILPPLDRKQREYNRRYTQQRRAAWEANGRQEPKSYRHLRIAGV